ncbi:hypothetical protein A33M_2572 [Rhodovulum sp. PH10]|nr:hypothetical protein A33M_2572 [Rhodovulum sp. PH10]
MIEVLPIDSAVPEFYHVAGIARFKITGMRIETTNIPQP